MILSLTSVFAAEDSAEHEGWWTRQFLRFHSYGHLDSAYRLMNQGRLTEARGHLAHYLTLVPSDRDARLTYVSLCFELKDFPEVLRAADQLLAEDPGLDKVRLQRALARQNMGLNDGAIDDFLHVARSRGADEDDRRAALDAVAHLATALERFDLAQSALDLLAARWPSYDVDLRRARMLQRSGRLDAAELAYRAALAAAADDTQKLDALAAVGTLLAQQQRWEEAERHFTLAYDLSPRDPNLLSQLAETAWAERDHAKTLHWTQARLAVSEDRRARELAANALYETNNYTGAIAELRQLLDAAPNAPERPRYALLLAEAYYAAKDYPSAIQWARQAMTPVANRRASEILARAYFDNRQYAAAADAFVTLLGGAESPSQRAEFQMYLGYAYMHLGRFAPAAEAFARAARHDNSLTARLAQAQAINELGDHAGLIALYEDLLQRPDLPPGTRDELSTQLGYLYSQRNDWSSAVASFQRVVHDRRGDWRTRLALGITLYESGELNKALASFLSVLDDHASAEAMLYAALCYKRLGKPGLAIHYLELARPLSGELNETSAIGLHDESGDLYAGEGDYARAAAAWRAALALEYRPDRLIRLARSERLSGNPQSALDLLEKSDAGSLDDSLRTQFFDELAAAFTAMQRYSEAVAALTEANAIAPSHARQFQLAMNYQRLGRLPAAQSALESAVAAEPRNDEYALALAYLHLRRKNDRRAAALFKSVLAREPDYVALERELGYIYMRLGENAKAVHHFRRTVDTARFAELNSAQPADPATERAIYESRAEISKLTNRIDVEAYHVFQQAADVSAPSPRLLGVGYAPSQGGLDVAYQPASFGFRNDKIFQFVGRVLWQSDAGSQRIDDDTVQGALGARYKPLRTHNLYLSAERRFGIGAAAVDDWLARGQYSHSTGLTLPPGTEQENYRTVYADLAYSLTGTHPWSYFAELRQGVTRALSESLFASPYASLASYGATENSEDENLVEAGVGLSLRNVFGGSRYRADTAQFELNVQYKASVSDHQSGWSAMLAMRF